MNLEFRPLLERLVVAFPANGFSSNDVVQVLLDPSVIQSSIKTVGSLPTLPNAKMVSKDLDRLYKMGFLVRTRQKRQVKTRKGTVCNKGFLYKYKFNQQGRSYVLNYLWNSEPRKPRKEMHDSLDLIMREYIKHQTSSQEEAEAHLAWYDTIFPCKNLRPVDKRFPVRRDPYLVELLLRVTKERDQYKNELPEIRKKIADLERQSS